MIYILTSASSDLREKFNSYDFSNNFDTRYNEITKEYSDVLHLPVDKPVVGDYLYFTDNYYYQIPVKVTRLVYGCGQCMIWCERAELYQIDPFIYAGPNAFNRTYTTEFVDMIKKAHFDLSDRFPKLIDEAKERYNGDVNEFNVIVGEIIQWTGIDKKTCIDFMNITYAVSEILVKEYPSKYTWHRPNKWEFSEY